jgi:oligopeptide transport system permease protein
MRALKPQCFVLAVMVFKVEIRNNLQPNAYKEVSRMGRYILDRLISALVTLLLIITVTFTLMHSIPGGPFDQEKAVSAQINQNIIRHYHLNDPLWKQYCDYLKNIFIHFDFGMSYKNPDQSVNDLIKAGFPVSASIGFLAVLVAVALGIPAGIFAALYHTKWQDNLVMLVAITGVSIPSFIVATLLQYCFSYKLQWLPAALWGSPAHLVLPVLALAALPLAFFARLIRSSMLEVLSQDYVRTARSKGLSEATVVLRHVLKNTLIPFVTVLGPMLANLLTGTFVIERIFAIPGLGNYFVNSIYNRDYLLILGLTAFYAAILLLINLIIDIVYAAIDPRIKLVAKEG